MKRAQVDIKDLEFIVKMLPHPAGFSGEEFAVYVRLLSQIQMAKDLEEFDTPSPIKAGYTEFHYKVTPKMGGGYPDKISAIKLHRSIFGTGLKEAKDIVDSGKLWIVSESLRADFEEKAKGIVDYALVHVD